DRHADNPEKLALIWENEEEVTERITCLTLREESNKIANALKKIGLTKGDRVIITLPRIPEAYMIYLGALKLGLVISPGSEMLTAQALLYRALHSEANATICYHD